ncbi:hypothetical protein MHBO_004600 [Bonamia ostreae]|uniref:Ribosomal protein L2 n=1 Tax=Bonamia ostreae TaxID=126728 RepID=A0ABV2ATS5_9EUKA
MGGLKASHLPLQTDNSYAPVLCIEISIQFALPYKHNKRGSQALYSKKGSQAFSIPTYTARGGRRPFQLRRTLQRNRGYT